MNQASLADANRLYFASLRQKNGGAQETEASGSDSARRQELMDAIEADTGKRPGANTKTETLEKQYAELNKDQE
ncbi:hypothetical protein [Vreelandella titanicae]|uniref:hypothetical protein n=1 Tax=Vreelandella titanicae TaxID=664683 RepID=UPI00381B2AF6